MAHICLACGYDRLMMKIMTDYADGADAAREGRLRRRVYVKLRKGCASLARRVHGSSQRSAYSILSMIANGLDCSMFHVHRNE